MPPFKGHYETFNCYNCGKEVTKWVIPSDYQSSSGHRYCSQDCVRAKARPRTYFVQEFVCEYCHCVFTRKTNQRRRFCSAKCRGSALRPQDPTKKCTFICKFCGKEFEDWAYRNTSYCSRKCSGKSGAGKTHPNAQKPEIRVEKKCLVCGKTFIANIHQIRLRGGGKYCSRECMGKAQSQKMIGSKHPRFKGYPPNTRGENWGKIKRLVYERDNNTCQNCSYKKEKRNLDVHHIIPYRLFKDHKSANVLSNLILLCRECHKNIELGKIPCPKPK